MRRLILILLLLPLLAACQPDTTRWEAAAPPPGSLTGADSHRLPASVLPPPPPAPATGPLKVTGTGDVALTFDDGPSPTYTPQMLALLRKHGIRATFCLVGTQAQAYPSLVQAIVQDGHALCNHSWNHDLGLGAQPDAAIRANLLRANEAIRKAAPNAPIRYYRQPGGAWTTRLVTVAESVGMRALHWQIDPQDWRQPSAEAIYNTVATQARPGAIVLLHDAGGNRSTTLTACQRLFPQLKSRLTLAPMP